MLFRSNVNEKKCGSTNLVSSLLSFPFFSSSLSFLFLPQRGSGSGARPEAGGAAASAGKRGHLASVAASGGRAGGRQRLLTFSLTCGSHNLFFYFLLTTSTKPGKN